MEISNSSLRQRLESLWSYVVSDKMKKELSKGNVVPQQFLDDKAIRLVPHVFTGVHDFNWGCSAEPLAPNMALPPVLFSPFKNLKDHPIKLEAMDTRQRKHATSFLEYGTPDPCGNVHTSCADLVSRHIEAWAVGSQIRRQVPRGALTLANFRGVIPVHKFHGLYADYGYLDAWRDGWDTAIYEYDEEQFHAVSPHVILLTTQRNVGYNGSMLRGELAVVLTAMRNRANQTVDHEEEQRLEEEEPEEAKENEKSEFIFKKEDRFPVLMISCVNPQHARTYYACMNDDELVIRQSKLYSFEKKNTALWDLFASILLSHPLDERSLFMELHLQHTSHE